ncbi:hypothetical protein [Paludibacter sp.]|uniref:hypothetical protein n=1 Tax=Paludibacter sp. TaxID=1898105 RepID=UPI001352A532|nr:hypothetical protein [Paludibacter sp.]MTK54127.1 hypothetical protein [Paludibacter sp.]
MADNSGNIIYVIAVIIAVLSSILSKKKTNRTEPEPSAPSTPAHSWEDVIRELTMDKNPVPSHVPEYKKETVQHKSQPFLDEEKKLHKDTVIKIAPVVTTTLNDPEEQEKVSLPDFSNYDEIKRGILFSEIFSRKF